LASASSITEIEVIVAPPTSRSQWNHLDSYFSAPRPYNPQVSSASTHNSPSIPPNFIFNHDITPLALPPQAGRRRAVSDSGTGPSMAPPQGLSRRVSSGSHPYLAVQDSGGLSGRSTPSRAYRKSYSSGSHMTPRDVLELVKNDGPREAMNPKKFVCDYPCCGQRFTRNSNKTYHPS
jgi:hypothetical protein